jgi:hypothetical protein
MKKALEVVQPQSGLVTRRRKFIYVYRNRFICYIICGCLLRCGWNINIFTPFMFAGLCDHTFLHGLETNIIGFNCILQGIKGHTSDHSLTLGLFLCWMKNNETIHKPTTLLENMKIPEFQLCESVNAIFVAFVYPSISKNKRRKKIYYFLCEQFPSHILVFNNHTYLVFYCN